MLVTFYQIALFACIEALVPNRSVISTLLPEHQQMYIIQGAMVACDKELYSERMLACTEDTSYCGR
jgi:hypothetical protein